LELKRNRIPTIPTRSKTKTRVFGTEEERVWSEDSHSSQDEGT
jgi:hypothetical protein